MDGGAFDAWALPSWADRPQGVLPVEPRRGRGPEVRRARLEDGAWLDGLLRGLGERARSERRTALERAEALGAVGLRLLDPGDPLRRRALEWLPATSGLSAAMAERVLEGMAVDWTPGGLRRLLAEELGGAGVLDGFVHREDRRVMAVGPRLCVQLVAGSVPGVGVSALIRSLLVGGPTLLKPGLGDVVLPVLFARGLADTAPDLADRLAVLYWPGGDARLEMRALAAADVVTAYGSDGTVRALRDATPVTTRFVPYHHREGVGVVGRGALGSAADATRAAEAVASAVAVFDQRGCVSTRTVFVEEVAAGEQQREGCLSPAEFAGRVADALETLEGSLPSGDLEDTERAGLHQLRGTAEMLAAAGRAGSGSGPWLRHGGQAPWTVVYDPGEEVESACVGRVVVIRPFSDLSELVRRLEPAAAHLQTVGVTGLDERLEALARALGRLGISRVAPFGKVPFPPAWWHHDGRGPLQDLVRWVDLERSGAEADGA